MIQILESLTLEVTLLSSPSELLGVMKLPPTSKNMLLPLFACLLYTSPPPILFFPLSTIMHCSQNKGEICEFALEGIFF